MNETVADDNDDNFSKATIPTAIPLVTSFVQPDILSTASSVAHNSYYSGNNNNNNKTSTSTLETPSDSCSIDMEIIPNSNDNKHAISSSSSFSSIDSIVAEIANTVKDPATNSDGVMPRRKDQSRPIHQILPMMRWTRRTTRKCVPHQCSSTAAMCDPKIITQDDIVKEVKIRKV